VSAAFRFFAFPAACHTLPAQRVAKLVSGFFPVGGGGGERNSKVAALV